MAVTTGLVAFVVVVAVAYLWSLPADRWPRRPVGRLARWLARWWIALGVAWLVMTIVFAVVPVSYGEAQLAEDAAEFEAIVGGDTQDYRLVAIFDLLFAAVYGLFALSLVPMVRSWRGDQRLVPVLRRVGSIGLGVLVVAALFDEAENVAVLSALGESSDLSDGTVDTMTFLGSVKWTLVTVGLAVFLAAAVTKFLSTRHARSWIRTAGLAYALYLGVVIAFVAAAAFHQRWLFWFLMPALAICGSWLNAKVSESRAPIDDDADAEEARRSAGWVRVRLAVIQLGFGAALVASGLHWPGLVGDTAVVLGVALVILSLGAFVSELRQVTWHPVTLARVLFAAAFVLLVAAYVISGNAAWACFGLAVVLGELGTELSAEAYQRRDDAHHNAPLDERLKRGVFALAVVAFAALLALIFIDVDPSHAVGLIVLLAVVVWMASIDGDTLVLVVLLALLLVASTRPGDQEADETLEAVPGAPYILVLGDSYTSGEGANYYLPGTNEVVHERGDDDPHTNDCRQAPSAWAFQLVDRVVRQGGLGDGDATFPTRVLFLACSGAVTENLRPPSGDVDGNQQLALFEARKQELGEPALVIVGIGGNDAGFGDIGKACVGPGNCATLAEQFLLDRLDREADEQAKAEALADISNDLDRAYRAIQGAVADDVPIVATAYPSPISTGGRCADTLLDGSERRFINSFVDQLNETVRKAAEERDLSYMDLSGALAKRGAQLCAAGPGGAGINFVAFGSKGGTIRDSLDPRNWSHNSLHPNPRGHAALTEEAYDWFSARWPLTGPTRDPAHPELRTAQEVIDRLGVSQCDRGPDCVIDGSVWLNEQAHDLFRDSIVILGLVMAAFRFALLPIVDAGRRADVSLFRIVRGRWSQI